MKKASHGMNIFSTFKFVGFRSSIKHNKINDFKRRLIILPLPGTDRCLLGKVKISFGKQTFYVGASLTERILEVIVFV